MLPVSDAVIFFLTLLLVASLSMPLLKKIRFPHSVFLVIAGFAIGAVSNWLHAHSVTPWIHELTGSLSEFQLSPDAVLFIFLPTLIFESSYNINSRELIKDLPYILLLAVPAFLVSIFTVGLMLHFICGLDLKVSLLFGALISATDPVAVIAIFKELGAPKRLTLLVEGESLCNDAAAIVIFAIFLGLLTGGQELSWGQSVVSGTGRFLVIFLGGIITGLALGYVFSYILGAVRSNPPVEILLTTMLAYLSFVIAHHFFHVSGVMSTMSAGILLGSYGRTRISPEVHEFMQNFWETISFSANAILFLCIGLLLPQYLSIPVLTVHLPLLIVAIIAINIGRAVPVFSLMPLLSSMRFVENISGKFMTVLWWGGGLRGAIAVALALSLVGSPVSSGHQQTVLLLTLGVVMFTLLVNATTIRRIISWLGMDRLTKDELYSQKTGLLHSKTLTHQALKAMSPGAGYYPDVYQKLINDYSRQEEHLRAELAGFSDMSGRERYDALAREALLLEKDSYFEAFTRGELSEISLRDLQTETDRELDRLKSGLPLFDSRLQFERKSWIEKLMAPVERYLPKHTTYALAMRYEKAKALISAINSVLVYIDQKGKEYSQLGPICEELGSKYMFLSRDAEEEIADIALNFPEYVDTAVEIVLRTLSLRTEQKHLTKMRRLGQLPEIVFNRLNEQIERQLSGLRKRPVEKIILEPVQLLKQVPFFNFLDEAHLASLARYLHTRPFLKGQILLEQGSTGEEMFIITRGVVRVFRGDINGPEMVGILKSGNILGEMSLISKNPRNASAVALSHCSTLALHRKHFQDFLDENPEVKARIYEVYRERE